MPLGFRPNPKRTEDLPSTVLKPNKPINKKPTSPRLPGKTPRKPIKLPTDFFPVDPIKQYLGTDTTYQNVVRGQKRSLADFLSELGRRKGESTTSFNDTKASMERDRKQQLDDLKNEFASRGLIQSGLFGQEQGQFQQQFTEQLNSLQKQQASLLADLLSQEKNYKREQELALEAARQEALQRRAAKLKLGA